MTCAGRGLLHVQTAMISCSTSSAPASPDSGEAVADNFEFELLERYLEAPENSKAKIHEEIDPMGVDVEMLENGMIPVGEAVAQACAVHAASWPRHPDAPILAPLEEVKEENRPFAKLSELKK